MYADCNKPEHARLSNYQPFWYVSSIFIHFPFLRKARLQDGYTVRMSAHVRRISNKRPPKNQTVISVHYVRANVWGGSNISAGATFLHIVKSDSILQSHGRSSANFFQTVHLDVTGNRILHTHPWQSHIAQIYDMIFIYCNWISTQWHWSVDWYKSRKEMPQKEKQYTK